MLTSEEITFYAKEDLNVLLSRAFEELKNLLLAIATKDQRRTSKEIADLLVGCCNKIKTYPLKKSEADNLFKHLVSRRPSTLVDGVKELYSYDGTLKGSTSEATKSAFSSAILHVLESATVSEAIDEVSQNFLGLQQNYSKADDDVFYKDPPFLYMSEYAAKYDDDFMGFVDHIEAAVDNLTISSSGSEDEIDPELSQPVHLMTALRAKGKEFDDVVMLEVNDGIWPSKLAETDDELEQERRVFYVGITRCRYKLELLTVDSILSKQMQPSPYLRELGFDLPTRENVRNGN